MREGFQVKRLRRGHSSSGWSGEIRRGRFRLRRLPLGVDSRVVAWTGARPPRRLHATRSDRNPPNFPSFRREGWGRRDLNPDRRVSPTRGATHACCCEPWVSAPVCHHRNQQTRFAIKPMTGARNSTRLNYVPMGLRTRGTAAGVSKFSPRLGALKTPFQGVVRFRPWTAAPATVTFTGFLAIETRDPPFPF